DAHRALNDRGARPRRTSSLIGDSDFRCTRFAEDNHMVDALASDRSDRPLGEAVIRYLGRRCLTCAADLCGSAYGATTGNLQLSRLYLRLWNKPPGPIPDQTENPTRPHAGEAQGT